MNNRRKGLGWFALILLILPVTEIQADTVKQAIEKPVAEAIEIRRKTQEQAETWADRKSALSREYDTLSADLPRLQEQHRRLTEQLRASEERSADLETQRLSLEQIRQRLEPFLEKVYERLTETVSDGLPFLPEEREARLAGLRATLDNPEALPGEKFRKIMETLAIESEYGRTVEVNRRKIQLDREAVQVDVLRVGRVALLFESLDRSFTGFYDPAEACWKKLSTGDGRDIRTTLEIAVRQRPADIVTLPVGRILIP